MPTHDHAARNGACNGNAHRVDSEKHAPPRGLGPNGAPWTYPEKHFEPGAFSPNLSLTPLDRVEARPPVWECGGRLRRGAVTIVAGEHGSGKSLLAVDWAARITRGESSAECRLSLRERTSFRVAKSDHPPGETVIAHACDLPLESLRRRSEAAGAAPGRIASLALAYPDDDQEFSIETIRRRVISLASAVRGTTDVRLLVIDNL
ncbi:MAG TPA: AAA family ATPase, partial [Pirellulales bacterium]|nr:AAA family ATPase [Pirellulales bacterium]